MKVPMATKLGRIVTYLDRLVPIESMSMTTKLGRILTYLDELLPVKSRDPLLM